MQTKNGVSLKVFAYSLLSLVCSKRKLRFSLLFALAGKQTVTRNTKQENTPRETLRYIH
jgi:hypothetical protein